MKRTYQTRAISLILPIIALIAATAPLTACNTTAGVGEDVSAAGHAVTNTADKVKNGL
jgi:predicted small secreted protein